MRPGSIVQQQAIMFGLLGIAGSSVACLVMLVVYRAVDPNGLVGFGAALIVAFLVSSCVIAVRGLSAQRR
ncbi:MAG: hypothetical protein LBD25_07190 [Coriobacteriales bacterium]|jgi:hypothetical protein|nr:hypothetical protein [Coriobacteriales bacterium]